LCATGCSTATRWLSPIYDPSGAIEFWNMTTNQDWEVSELAQLGINSRAYTPRSIFRVGESMIAAWDRAYLTQMGG